MYGVAVLRYSQWNTPCDSTTFNKSIVFFRCCCRRLQIPKMPFSCVCSNGRILNRTRFSPNQSVMLPPLTWLIGEHLELFSCVCPCVCARFSHSFCNRKWVAQVYLSSGQYIDGKLLLVQNNGRDKKKWAKTHTILNSYVYPIVHCEFFNRPITRATAETSREIFLVEK